MTKTPKNPHAKRLQTRWFNLTRGDGRVTGRVRLVWSPTMQTWVSLDGVTKVETTPNERKTR